LVDTILREGAELQRARGVASVHVVRPFAGDALLRRRLVCGGGSGGGNRLKIRAMLGDVIHVVFVGRVEFGERLQVRAVERLAACRSLTARPPTAGAPRQSVRACGSDLSREGGTMGLVHIVVKSCFRTAVKKKLLAANPVEDAERPSAEDEEAGTVMEEEELEKLVKAFEGHSLYPIVATAAYTGARRSEILALRWQDIDLDRRTILITRSIERVKVDDRMVRRVKGPKKAKHARTIQIDAGLAALLRREKDKHLRLVAGVPDGAPVDLSLVKLPEEALAFPAVGEALTAFRPPNAVTTVFHDYAIGLGWDLRFHDLRATHETILLDKGVPVHVVAKRCGHDPAMLLKVYAKRTQKADAKAAGVIGTLTQGVLGQDWVEPFRCSQDVPGESLK